MKKTMKQMLAALLAVAMVITGLYVVPTVAEKVQAEETEEWTTAEQVPTEMLDVKFQTAKDGSVMRFISSVDSLDYYKAGFYVTPVGGSVIPHDTKTVYERIKSTTDGVEYEFSPKVVDTTSGYFVTAKMEISDPAQYYTVQAYVILRDGLTVVSGEKRCVCANDGLTSTPLNLSFVNDTATVVKKGDKLDVTYTTDNAGTATTDVVEGATVIGVDGTTVHVSVDVSKASLRSATRFTFASGETTVGSEIYRNLYTEYSVVGADTSWYNICESGEKKFTIATDADLYGFQSLSITDGFSTKTIYMVSDIKANSNTPSTKEEWDTFDKKDLIPWYGIGGNTSWTFKTAFAGIFDGQGHTLSGIYGSAGNTMCYGLFRATASGSTVKNFRLEDSYLTSSNVGLGSIVGRAVGTFNNIYSNAVVINTGDKYVDSGKEYYVYGTGGIIGVVNWAGNATITNSQFDGYAMVYSLCGGGIVGGVYNGKSLTMNYCHNSGTLAKDDTIVEAARLGGLCGDVSEGTLSIANCLNVGARSTTYTNRTGSLIGLVDTNGKAVINNTYGTGDSWSSKLIGATSGTVSGSYATSTVTNTSISGYSGTSLTGLDYSNYWTLMADGTPALTTHAKNGRLYYPDVEWDTTEDGKYKISTPEELSGVAYKVNTGDTTAQSASYVLTKDIALNKEGYDWEKDVPVYEWMPIGRSETTAFKGILNGAGYTISGVYIDGSTELQALFGITKGATIEKVAIVGGCVKNSAHYTAGVVGRAISSTIQSVYVDVDLISTSTSEHARVGGICGQTDTNTITIEKCWFDGTITSVGGRIGGLVGNGAAGTTVLSNSLVSGSIKNTYESSVLYVGGIIGGCNNADTNKWEIKNCLHTVNMNLKVSTYAGKVVGHSFWTSSRHKAEDVYASSAKAVVNNVETTINIANGTMASFAGIKNLNDASLLGYDAMAQGAATGLDYTNDWALRDGKIPVPATLFELFCSDDIRLNPANAPQ